MLLRAVLSLELWGLLVDAMVNAPDLRLYYIADPEHIDGDLLQNVAFALAGGVTTVQLRAKHWNDDQTLATAKALRTLTRKHNALLIINDRVDIAMAARADGVHLGVNDLPIEAIRELVSADFLIGFSPEDPNQISGLKDQGVSYLGIGPVFQTLTKSDAGQPLGLDEFARRAALTLLPVVGIGGIVSSNAGSVVQAGGAGVAVVTAIGRANDPQMAAQSIRRSVIVGG